MIWISLISLNAALLNYAKAMENAKKAKESIHPEKLSVIIGNGFDLIDLSKLANDMYGRLLAVEYLYSILGTVGGIFASLNIFKAFATFEPGLILMCTSGLCTASVALIRLHSFVSIGQHLCEAYVAIKDWLGQLLMMDGITDKQRRGIEFLVNQFSIRSPIRPLDMFDMNYANCAVLNNIMFTYTIILMQFKGY